MPSTNGTWDINPVISLRLAATVITCPPAKEDPQRAIRLLSISLIVLT